MKGTSLSAKELAQQIEAFFGEKVMQVTAPGGKGRGSFRVYFEDRSIIVSSRRSEGRTGLEAHVLEALQHHTEASARFLGLDGPLMYQADVGGVRLSQKIQELDGAERDNLADLAVGALFDIHRAGRQTNLIHEMPQLGASEEWVESFVRGIGKLTRKLQLDRIEYDLDAVCDFIGTPAVQFVKWDCRSGNAALDENGIVRWFDFEYSGIRHGAEDFAWLIADEIWPVSPDTMLRIMEDRFDPSDERPWDDYRTYLEVYTTLHAIQRLMLIVNGAKKKGQGNRMKKLAGDK